MASPLSPAATGELGNVRSAWGWVVDTCLVLWITRVSFASVIAGFALLLFVPQARDTFLEVRGESYLSLENIVFWLFFLVTVVIFWTLPVHYCARRNLDFDPINTDPQRRLPPERRARVDQVSILVPRILAAACLLAVGLASFFANAGLRTPFGDGVRLYAEAHSQTYLLGFLALLLMVGVWKLLVKRRDLAKRLETKRLKLDRDFGQTVLVILMVVFGLLLVIPTSWIEQLTMVRAPLIPLLLGGWVPPLAWLAYKGRVYRAPFILALFLFLELLTVAGNNHDVRTRFIKNSSGEFIREGKKDPPGRAVRYQLNDKINAWRRANRCPDKTKECDVRPIVVAASGGASRAGFFTAAVLGRLTDLTQSSDKYRDFRQQLFAISSVSGSSTGAAFFVAAVRDSEEPELVKKYMRTEGEQPCLKGKVSPLVHSNKEPTDWQACMETLLSGDFLSSTLFAVLYKDSLRGLWAAFSSLTSMTVPDRAVILEQSWERHYCEYTGACDKDFNGLSRPFLSVARLYPCSSPIRGCPPAPPETKPWVPLLFINTTDVDTGRRVIISPVAPRTKDERRLFSDAYDLHELMADEVGSEGRNPRQQGVAFGDLEENYYFIQRDIRLSTAAGLSARFPLVSPPGDVRNRRGNLVARLVDGGYFENFGAATALDIAQRLRDDGLDPVIIQITNEPQFLGARQVKFGKDIPLIDGICKIKPWNPVCESDPPVIQVSTSYLLSEVRGPLSGLFGARQAHGARALLELANSGNTPATKNDPAKVRNGCAAPNVRQKEERFVQFFVRPQYFYNGSVWDEVVALFGDGSRTCRLKDVSMSWWLSKPVQAYLHHEVEQADFARAILFMETSK